MVDDQRGVLVGGLGGLLLAACDLCSEEVK